MMHVAPKFKREYNNSATPAVRGDELNDAMDNRGEELSKVSKIGKERKGKAMIDGVIVRSMC
jgi:hypothetical protein